MTLSKNFWTKKIQIASPQQCHLLI